MKTLFIEAKKKVEFDQEKIIEISKKLPRKIALVYSIQYKDLTDKIKEVLDQEHEITKFTQVLGCSKPNISEETQAILLISSGRFHGVSLAHEAQVPVYILKDNSKLEKVSEEEIDNLKKKQKSSYVNYLNAKKIGVLISTKPGQQKLKRAIDFKRKQREKDSYLFLSNEISPNEFENFKIDSWVNTVCPRMDLDSNTIINMDKIEN